MTAMKKVLCLLLCLTMVLSLASCGFPNPFDDRAKKEAIFAYVKEHENALLECIEKNEYLSIRLSTKIIQGIDDDDIGKGFVDFDCGGAGFGPGTAYCGFYYSADDNLTGLWCSPRDSSLLKQSGNGYLWEQSWTNEGDNTYYTENICGHFYYYEASF